MKDHGQRARTLAIIPSAGLGRRMGSRTSKNYLDLLGKPILAHTLGAFEDCRLIDEVVVVVTPGDEEYCRKVIIEGYGIKKVARVLGGGEERQGSVRKGLPGSEGGTGIIVVHDGARPLVTARIIERTVEEARVSGAAVTAVRVKDTIKKGVNGSISSTVARDGLFAVQTPQAFRTDILVEAFKKAEEDGFTGTDESSLVERLGAVVRIVEGSYENIKITTEEDLLIAECILRNRK
jgi:2-C-methyl-D-erythritol 4-phosphate cytidylyltransferase